MQTMITHAAALLEKGHAAEAARLYREILKLAPEDARMWSNLGNALGLSGEHQKALSAYARAVGLRPDNAMMRFNLGATLLDQERLDEARGHLVQCAGMAPDFSLAHERLGDLYFQMNDKRQSLISYDRAMAIRPGDAGLAWSRCLAELSICHESEAAMTAAREAYARRLRSLVDVFDPTDSEMVLSAFEKLHRTPFYLAYQGRNDVDPQRLFGRYLKSVMQARLPGFSKPRAMPGSDRDGRWRIGFVSKYFARHSVWKLPLRGWLEHLDRKRFRVFGYATTACPDTQAARLCDSFIHGERSVEELARLIADNHLHALIFPEIGMDWKTICLAALHLAPVQLAGAGHPVTTGLESIDVFLSSQMMEPPTAINHYTEKLALLPNLSSFNYPPEIERPMTRRQLGLPENGVLYFTPQSIFKYLPRFDDVFARIAREVPDARFLFIRHEMSKGVTSCFRNRIQKHFRDRSLNPIRHVFFLPRMHGPGFTTVCGACDIFLDNIGWSGNNTSLEAIWQGVPVITLPLELMRSRHAAANLSMTGVAETICPSVDEFVQMAIEFGLDHGKRKSLARKLFKGRQAAFGDTECVRGLEAVLEGEISQRRG